MTCKYMHCSSLTTVGLPNTISSIKDGTFSGCSSLLSLSIPQSVTQIDCGAFNLCDNLVSIILPSGLTSIGNYAFRYCGSLISITIPSALTSIGYDAFSGCNSLSSVYISDLASWCRMDIEYNASPLCYGHHLFLNGSEIKDLIIPNSVSEIKENTFSGGYFNTITIPEGIVSIGKSAFEGCRELKSITLPNSLESLGVQLFYGCNNLESILIPNRVTKIETNTFLECTNLSKVTIPDNVVSIGEQAFEGCLNLKSIKLPSGLLSIERSAFRRCMNLNSISIPDGVTMLNEETFYDCNNLKSVKLPDRLYIIGKNVFKNCGLESIIIPEQVEYIYQEAFADCPLESVKVLSTKVPFAYNNTFSNYNIPLYVPNSSIEDYHSTNPWSNFTQIMTLDGTEIDTKKCATPTIAYKDGKLIFGCETEGVEFVSEITVSDNKMNYSNEVSLTGIYKVSVYATKAGYENSETVTEEIDVRGLMGDMNEDGNLSVTDVTILIDKILKQK